MAGKTHIIKAYLGLSLAIFFWAVNTLIARSVICDIKPLALAFYRWIIAFLIILPFALPYIKKDLNRIKKNLGFLFILSLTSVASYNSILYMGAQYTTATNISLVVATMPGLTILMAWMINRERPVFSEISGAGISLSGLLIIISKGSLNSFINLKFNPGDLCIIVSITLWSLYSVLLRKKSIGISPVSFLSVLFFIGIICIFPFYIWEYTVYKGFEIKALTVSVFIYLGIFPSILSYICWNYGVKTAGSSKASVFMYLSPVFTCVLAFLFLGENFYLYHIWGSLLILAGLLIASYKV